MRTDIPADVLTAFSNPNGIHPSVRMTVYKSRHFFEHDDLDITHAAGFAQEQGIHDLPLAQDVKFSPPNNVLVSVFASSGTIWAAIEGHDPVQITVPGGSPLETDDLCRPALWCEQQTTTATVYFYRPTTKHIRRARFAITSLLQDDPECVVELVDYNVDNVERSSLHAISTDNLIVLSIYEGGVKITNITGSSVALEAPRRIMHPTKVWDATNDNDVALLNFSGAVHSPTTDTTFIYLSNPVDGNVWGAEWYGDSWSDIFEALPADLSRFKIANVIAGQNGTIHMCRQFQRVDNVEYGGFASSWIYGLDLWSADGRTFSLDRFTLFALGDPESTDPEYDMAYRFQMAWKEVENEPSIVYYADANRLLSDTAPSSIVGDNAEKVVIDAADIRRLSQGSQGEYEVALRAGSEEYFNHPLMKLGARVVLEMGTLTANGGREYYQLDDCIITAIPKSFGDAKREHTLQMISNTLWRTSVMTHPFYLEINSKQSLYDDVDEFDNLYMTDQDNSLLVPFMVDFWDSPESPISHGPGTESLITRELTSRGLSEFPPIEALPITCKVYGWSRAGGKSVLDDLSPGDDTPVDPDAVNDVVQITLHIIREDETEADIVISAPKEGETARFPRGWQTSAPGYYPVTLIGDVSDNLKIGDRIKTLAVDMVNENASDETTFYIERVEIPEVFMKIAASSDTWSDYTFPVEDAISRIFKYAFNNDEEGWTFIPETPAIGTPYSTGAWENGALCIYMPEGAYYNWYKGTWKLDIDPTPVYHSSYYAPHVKIDNHDLGTNRAFGLIYTDATKSFTDAYTGTWPNLSTDADITVWTPGKPVGGIYWYGQENGGDLNKRTMRVYDFHITNIVQQQQQNGTLTWNALRGVGNEKGYCQTHQEGVNCFDKGLYSYVQYTNFSACAGYRIDSPQNLGKGNLAIKMRAKDARLYTGSKPTQMKAHFHSSWLVSGDNPLGSCPQVTLNIGGDSDWLIGNQDAANMKTFSNFGSFNIRLDNVSGTDLNYYEVELEQIDWIAQGGTRTTLWLPNATTISVVEEGAKSLNKIGSPAVLLATKPYSTFGFKAASEFDISGEGAWGGVVGLAKDGQNYIAARACLDRVQILKMRGGVVTTLAADDLASPIAEKFWIMLEHSHGHFDVYIRHTSRNTWGAPVLSYDWTEADGPLAVDADMMHVGTYALRDVPYVQITGLEQGADKLGVLPISGHFFDTSSSGFPDEGTLSIEGNKYRYTGKIMLPEGMLIGGPYQCRNTGLGNNYSSGGVSYTGNSVDFTRYEEISNSENYGKFDGTLMGTSIGMNWLIGKTDFHPTTKTHGQVIVLRNRGKFFSSDAYGDMLGKSQKAWITCGFSGISLLSGEATLHYEGEFAFLERDTTVKLLTFMASSDQEDCTVEDMCERICRLAGGAAEFPGDTVVAQKTLSRTEWKVQ